MLRIIKITNRVDGKEVYCVGFEYQLKVFIKVPLQKNLVSNKKPFS